MTNTNPHSSHRPSRRTFIGGAAGTVAAAGLLGALPESTAGAATKSRASGSLADIKHVVILMQENRSFDHLYGTMQGVRGLRDKTAITLPTGQDVYHQPDPQRPDGLSLRPFHVDTTKVDGQDLSDLDHSWPGTHAAWAEGNYDAWVAAKTELTMSHFTRDDVPFHRALAGAFTICDNYYCSIQGPTTPNRLYHWTGMIDPNATAGGPAISNPDDYKPVYSWRTYPERLQQAGVSWQVYANDEIGDGSGDDGYVGDYGDNPLWLFQAYHDALASTDPAVRQLAERASLRTTWKPNSGLGKKVDHVLAQFIGDCASGSLPQVSWVVAPYAYSEHPQARPVDGAAYVQGVLNALWSNKKLWESTAVFINYDENDGFFDHVPPPTAPLGTPDEYVLGLPIGLGPRVPMTVISPWSRGGWVNSEVFDHTSVIRFLEQWTGVHEPNISAWRRSICGDLTSCFDFSHRYNSIPTLPNTAALRSRADATQTKLPPPATPAIGHQTDPTVERGTRRARPIPYQPLANFSVQAATLAVSMLNRGTGALQLAVYTHHLPASTPTHVDLAPAVTASEQVALVGGSYNVAVHGPNGFMRRAQGSVLSEPTGLEAALELAGTTTHPLLTLILTNKSLLPLTFLVTGQQPVLVAALGQRQVRLNPLGTTDGWYDLTVTVKAHPTFLRRFTGHLENGKASRTG